ncbi:MAG: DNA repair protein RecO [Anaerolineaceae bacterium]|nr:DNA repair protein RecO [Anaerolineaceae bacterium]
MREERSRKVEAVVLRHSDWGEADRLLVIFTREAGKLRVVAKGARKLKSRKAGHLEPFTCVTLMLARGRDFWIVTQADTVDAFLPLKDDLIRIGYAAYVVELLDRFTYEEGETPGLYRLLKDTLYRLMQEEDLPPVLRYYELRFLDLVGFRPDLVQCVGCGQKIEAVDQFFSMLEGGVLCPQCGLKAPHARPVSMPALKYLRHYQRSTYSEARNAGLPKDVRSEVEGLLHYYLTYLLEYGLKTPAFIRMAEKSSRRAAGNGDKL